MPWFRKNEAEKQIRQAMPVSLPIYLRMFDELMGPFAEFWSFNQWLFSSDSQEERTRMSDHAWDTMWDRVDADVELMTARYASLWSVRPPDELLQVHGATAGLVSQALPVYNAMTAHRIAAAEYSRTGSNRHQREMMKRHHAAVDAINISQKAAIQFWLSLERLHIVNPEIRRHLLISDELLASLTPGETPRATNAIRAQLRIDVEEHLRKRR